MSFLLVCTTRPRGCCSESKGYNYGRVCFVDSGGPGRTERGPFGKTCVLTCSLALNLNTEQTAAAVKMSRLEPKQSTHVLFLLKVTFVFFIWQITRYLHFYIEHCWGSSTCWYRTCSNSYKTRLQTLWHLCYGQVEI